MSPVGSAQVQSSVARTVFAGGLIALAAIAGLVASSCGSSSSSSSTSTSAASPSPTPTPQATLISKVDACSLVKVDEASTAAKATVVSGTNGVQIPGACFYASADGSASVLVFAQVLPDASTAGAMSPEQMAAAMGGAYGIANAKPVSGIGDKAVEYSYTSGPTSGDVIFVFKSNVVMMIALAPADTSALEALAKTAVGRL